MPQQSLLVPQGIPFSKQAPLVQAWAPGSQVRMPQQSDDCEQRPPWPVHGTMMLGSTGGGVGSGGMSQARNADNASGSHAARRMLYLPLNIGKMKVWTA